MDEVMADKVVRYESSDLSERHKTALRIADALMTLPGEISPALRDAAHREFDSDEIVELVVDVMKWNNQKIAVALGIDAEVEPGRLTVIEIGTYRAAESAGCDAGSGNASHEDDTR